MNDSLVQQIVGGIVRTLIAAAGAALASGGIVLTGTQLDTFAGILTIMLMGGWSVIQKWWAAQSARTGAVSAAVASAQQGTPVTVTVTPPGEDNIATRVSATEQASAPTVPLNAPPQPPPLP